MRIELRDAERRKVGRIEVDPARRPTRVHVQESDGEVFLDWWDRYSQWLLAALVALGIAYVAYHRRAVPSVGPASGDGSSSPE